MSRHWPKLRMITSIRLPNSSRRSPPTIVPGKFFRNAALPPPRNCLTTRDIDPGEIDHVPQRLKHLARKIAGQVDRTLEAVVEAQPDGRIARVPRRSDSRQHAATPGALSERCERHVVPDLAWILAQPLGKQGQRRVSAETRGFSPIVTVSLIAASNSSTESRQSVHE